MAATRSRPKWTRAEDDIIEAWYGLVHCSEIATRIMTATGIERSKNAVRLRANILGMKVATAQDGVPINEAARILGVGKARLSKWVRARDIALRGRGSVRLISYDDLERLKSDFPPIETRTLRRPEAAKLLGYDGSYMPRLAKAGLIKAVKVGNLWHYDAESVERLAIKLRRSGTTRLDLKGLAWFDHERQRCREYQRRRRAEQAKATA